MKKDQIIIHYGTDIAKMVLAVCDAIKLKTMISPAMDICLKPNLVVGKPASTGATTSPEIADALIAYLHDAGCTRIKICESSWVGGNTRQAFKTCGYKKIADKYGIPLIDAAGTKMKTLAVKDMHLTVSREFLETDFLINLPVLKGHCQVKMTCAMKNLKGCIPDGEKRRYHTLGIHKPVAYLNTILPQHFILVDALQGDLTFEEGGTPVRMDRIFAGTDPVLIDTYAAKLMGLTPADIEYIKLGGDLRVGSTDLHGTEISELGLEDKKQLRVRPNNNISRLAERVIQDDACSACYGSLIHALSRLERTGTIDRLPDKLCIGQGFQGKKGKGIGIGRCTENFPVSLRGCPPTALEIKEFLHDQLK